MNLFDFIKIVASTIIQIELSPQIWLRIGFTKMEVYTIVMVLSFMMVMINISILEFGVYILGVNKSKPRLGHKIALVIHKFGLLGLLLSGIAPWPPIIGVAQPIAYLLYCKVEEKAWYKPNIGMLALFLGIAIKMFLIVFH